MASGSGGPYNEDFGAGALKGKGKSSLFEWWKMWLGHIELNINAQQVAAFVTNAVGIEPKHVHVLQCKRASSASSSGDDDEVGLNSAFVEFSTLGRL